MPMYPFIDEATGETVELMYSMSEAPSIGTTVEVDGRV